MALQTKQVTLNGQTFTLTAIPGDVAHDNMGRIVAHIAAGLSQIPGFPLAPFIAGVDEEGKPIERRALLVAAMAHSGLDLAAIAAAIGTLFARLPAPEARSLRELLLAKATMLAEDGKPIAVLDALKSGQIKGGPLTICILIAHAVELSILPFTALDVSALVPPTPVESSKESAT